MKNDMSYWELAELTAMFEKEIEERGILFPHEDARAGAWMNFCEQYSSGVNEPSIELCDGVKEVNITAFGKEVPTSELQKFVDDGISIDELTTEFIETALHYEYMDNLL